VKDFADNIEALTGNIDQLAEKLAQLGRSASVLNPYSERGQTIRTQALTSPGDIVGSRSFGEIGARAVFRQVPGLSDEAVKDLARRAVAR
jgi:hypothetical protein